LNSSENTLCK